MTAQAELLFTVDSPSDLPNVQRWYFYSNSSLWNLLNYANLSF
jgi:hypothetical protein